MRAVLVVVIAIACGGKRDSEPPPAPVPPAPPALACAPGELVAGNRCTRALSAEQVELVGRQVSRLAAAGSWFNNSSVLDQARDVFAALHELAAWKRAAAKDVNFHPVDPAALHTASEHADGLRVKLAEAARQIDRLHGELAAIAKQPEARTVDAVRTLVSTRIVDTFGQLGIELGAASRDWLGPLPTQIVHEIVLVRDQVCTDKAREPLCARMPAIHAVSQYLSEAGPRAQEDFGEAGRELARLGDLLDARARRAIHRATGHGPSHGQPCGPDGLCERDHHCERATRTCEESCDDFAKEPCSDPSMVCGRVSGLDGTFCRPR